MSGLYFKIALAQPLLRIVPLVATIPILLILGWFAMYSTVGAIIPMIGIEYIFFYDF